MRKIRINREKNKFNTKKMRRIAIGLCLGALVCLNACKKDPEVPEIPNDEVEGDVRDRFVGYWTVTEASKLLGSRNFEVSIKKDTSYPAQVNMSNFYSTGDSTIVTATVSSVLVNVITVQNQVVNGSAYGGTGEMENDNKIKLSYTVDDGNGEENIDTVTAVFVR